MAVHLSELAREREAARRRFLELCSAMQRASPGTEEYHSLMDAVDRARSAWRTAQKTFEKALVAVTA